MTAAQWFAVGVLTAVLIACLAGILYMLANEACREHYRRAGVEWESHVDDALEVTR